MKNIKKENYIKLIFGSLSKNFILNYIYKLIINKI